MAATEARAIRRAMRDKQGELRDIALERMRHAARRLAMLAERERRKRFA